jgi:hypothetical protein
MPARCPQGTRLGPSFRSSLRSSPTFRTGRIDGQSARDFRDTRFEGACASAQGCSRFASTAKTSFLMRAADASRRCSAPSAKLIERSVDVLDADHPKIRQLNGPQVRPARCPARRSEAS